MSYCPSQLQPLSQGPQERYGQCDSTCTTDCGHCKGAGAPPRAAESPAEPSEVVTLRAQLSTLQSQISRMQDDVATIGEHLKKTAERHEWCGEYEEHLGRLLEDLSEHTADTLKAAATRQREYVVTYTVRVNACNTAEAYDEAAQAYNDGFSSWVAREVDE